MSTAQAFPGRPPLGPDGAATKPAGGKREQARAAGARKAGIPAGCRRLRQYTQLGILKGRRVVRTARVPAVTGRVMYRPGRVLPGWATVLAVVAHPDDETFGLGAVLGALTADGAVVHLLCYTRGEASTLNESGASLRQARAEELRQASSALGVATVTLLDYPGPPGQHVAGRAGRQRHQADCPPPAGR